MGETHGSTGQRVAGRRAETSSDTEWERMVERLFIDHFEAMCRSARRLLDTVAAAEDVVQEAFLRFSSVAHRPAPGREVAYLHSIVMNEARSVLRHRQVCVRHRHELVASADHDVTWRSALTRYEAEQVGHYLAILSERQREVVTLRHLVGLSERETATALQISAGSVKTHTSRGLSSIRRHLLTAA